MSAHTLSIVVPVYNESATVVQTVSSLKAFDWGMPLQLVVSDDGSTDDTVALLAPMHENGEILLVRNAERRGRGSAVRAGALHATGSIIAFHDADMEYAATDVRRAASFIISGQADAVMGSRVLGPRRTVMQYWRSVANRFVTLLSNAFTNLNLTDATTSCVVMRRDVWNRLDLVAAGFDADVEIVAALARSRVRIWEVPVSYEGRWRMQGRKSRRRDTGRRIWRIITSYWRGNGLLQRTQQ